MSLLLDALKKAAEQKAENSGETDTELASSVETVLFDETELADETRSNIAPENETLLQQTQSDQSQLDDPRLDLSQSEETELERKGIDETDFGVFDRDETSEPSDKDETLILTDDDVTDFLGDSTLLRQELEREIEKHQKDTEFETVFTQTSIEQDASERQTGYSPNEPLGDEPSISLFDEDDTLTTAEAAKQTNALSEETSLDKTPLVDITRSINLVEVPDENASEIDVRRSETQGGSTSISEADSQTLPGEETSARQDSTSTRTYAPDNYDRTLIKPANADASNIFAGLKSDSDVVMTPEYAKTMFLSKSSAQRIHNFKIYAGTALIIILVIAVVGILEIDDNTNKIDDSLRHLKRDPMPGLIKNKTDEAFTNIFAATPGSEVDATTLQLVENAELIVDTADVVAVELGIEVESLVENTNPGQTDSEKISEVEAQQTPITKTKTKVNNKIIGTKINRVSVREDAPTTDNTIQISSNTAITEKDRWLREAYAAYQRGDDQIALEKYNAVLNVDPQNRNALLARAAINIQNNRIAAAIRDYRTLLIANPKDSLAMSSMIAVANYTPEQSETQLKLMLRDEPASPYLNFALGNIFGAQNRWQEAQSRYFAALENNPDDPNYAYNLAVSLEHIAKPEVAVAYYERALVNFSNGLATFDRDVVGARLEMLRRL